MTGVPHEESLLRDAAAGERAAVERLYATHIASARRLATILVGTAGADHLVSESFSRALAQLRAGQGPRAGFGPFLHSVMRDTHRASSGVVPPAGADRPDSRIDPAAAAAALATLPGGWQQVLWHTDVEGRSPEEVAQLLGTSPASVTSLAKRARKQLHDAYLDRHPGPPPADEACGWTRKRLAAYTRGDLGRRARAKVADHLIGCSACTAAHSELKDLHPKLGASVLPIVLVGAMGAVDVAANAVPGAEAAPGPDQLVTELNARAGGAPAAEAAPAAGGVSRGLGDLPGRASITVAATVIAVVAIAATSWGLSRQADEQKAGPESPETGDVTFGPTPPAVPPTTGLPTLPEATTPTFPTSTTSSLPTTRAPLPTTATSYPTYPTSTYPYPTSRTPYTPPTTAPTSPTTSPTSTGTTKTEVTPVAPTATKIGDRCGHYGTLRMAKTEGVRYTLVDGDGRQGKWTVVARAKSGYVIADGAKKRWGGNLGTFVPCPSEARIRGVAVSGTGAEADPWRVAVNVRVPKKERGDIALEFLFENDVVASNPVGAGWECSQSMAGPPQVVCTYDNTTEPPPVSFAVTPADGTTAPSGEVDLRVDGDVVDNRGFAAPQG